MQVATDKITTVPASLEQAAPALIPDGASSGRTTAAALLEELSAISRRSAERLRDHEVLTDADLYGEDGVPAGPCENA